MGFATRDRKTYRPLCPAEVAPPPMVHGPTGRVFRLRSTTTPELCPSGINGAAGSTQREGEKFMPKEDRDPARWQYKDQTRVKHEVLSNYLTRWIAILGRPRSDRSRVLHYVDSFAGRGRYTTGEAGSPIIAMEVGHRLHEARDGDVSLRCYNVEHDEENFASLEREVDAAKPLYPSVNTKNYFGTFQEHEDRILGEIPVRAAAFVFFDPFGYGGVELDRVLRIVQRRYHEVFVNFQSFSVNRFMEVPDKAPVMDTMFETGEWRGLRGSAGRQQKIVELYGRQLQRRASDRFGIAPLYVFPINVRFPDRDADIYHLIHVSRSPKARLTMEEAVRSADLLGQGALPLFAVAVENRILEALGQHGELRAIDVAGQVWINQEFWNAMWRTEIRDAIRALEAAGQVHIRSYDGRRRQGGSGVKEKDLVRLNGGR